MCRWSKPYQAAGAVDLLGMIDLTRSNQLTILAPTLIWAGNLGDFLAFWS
jgi:hypothetical protein